MCADGYQPHIVENEPTISYNYYYDETTIYYYFTCCPPKLLFDANTSVCHCFNTTTFSDFNNTMICEDDNRPYTRQMKNYINYWEDEVALYMCCNSEINSNSKQTTNVYHNTLININQ